MSFTVIAYSFQFAWLENNIVKREEEMIVPFLSARIGWVNVFLLSVIAVFLPERLYGRVESWFISSKLWVKIIVFISVVQLILEFSGSEVSPFIYFQF